MGIGLLTEPPADKRITGKIVSAVSPGWWIVEDSAGRKYRAAGSGLYRKNDRVVILAGQIVDAAGTAKTAEVHQV